MFNLEMIDVDWVSFMVGLSIGMLFIYMTTPQPDLVYKTPANASDSNLQSYYEDPQFSE